MLLKRFKKLLNKTNRLVLKRIILIGSALALPIFLWFFSQSDERVDRSKEIQTVSEMVQTGDIIFRYGTGATGRLIVAALNESHRISHCGIVVEKQDGSKHVIHAVSNAVSERDGMQMCTLNQFIENGRPNTIRAVRAKSNMENAGIMVAKHAYQHLMNRTTFDHDFNVRDHSTIYCSELLYLILHEELEMVDLSHESGVAEGVFGFAWAADTVRFQRLVWSSEP